MMAAGVVAAALALVVAPFAGSTPHLAPAGGLAAQVPAGWATRSARLDVDLSAGDGSALVRVRYELAADAPGAPLPLDTPIELELLGFGPAAADEVLLGDERVVLWPTVGSHRAAVVAPPASFEGDVLPLVFTYRVERAVWGDEAGRGPAGELGSFEGPAIRARVPVLAGPTVLTDVGAPAFEARIVVPDGWALSEGFPSGLRRGVDGSYAVTLAVVPAVVGFRARTDGTWRPGVPLLIDVLTILIVVGFAGFGWRHLRGVARRSTGPVGDERGG